MKNAEQTAERLLAALTPTNTENEPSSSLRNNDYKSIQYEDTESPSSPPNIILINIKKWNDALESDFLSGNSVGSGKQLSRGENSVVAPSIIKDASNKLHSSLLTAVPSFVCREDGSQRGDDFWGLKTDIEADEASWSAANLLSASSISDDLKLLAELLRSAGLFVRWFGQVLTSNAESDFSKNPTFRLKSKGMLLLYCKLLDMEISTRASPFDLWQ